MSDTTIDLVEDVLDDEKRTDVTEEYADAVEMLVELAESRSVPIPMKHVVVYEDERHPTRVIALIIVDVNEDVIDGTYAFEFVAGKEEMNAIADDEDADAPEFDLAMQSYRAQLRTVQEALWDEVVNLGDD
jgi:hypothetical protein